MQSLAQELAPAHIRVNAIAPGAIRTPINRSAWETPQAVAKLLELIPYGRIGEPLAIANAVLFLASDLSDYVTGATLRSEEHTSELQSLMRNSHADFCFQNK